ncbi:MAG TPA: PQQ-dependent sugar dehydrogenase [Acidimicrobiia bacterium]|nr:PQQ-dependent sugar dehydrogenase [Acidimicrobiia bacterium]
MTTSRRSPMSFAAGIAILAATALLVAGCSDSGGSSTSKTTSSSGGDVRVKLTPVARVDDPTAFTTRTGDRALYVTEQVGRVRAMRDGALDPRPVLDITDQVGSGGERGLLGIAFSPDGSKLYLYYTNRDGDIRVDEYPMSGNAVDTGSRRQLLAVDHPAAPNHNGGQLSFGPDGKLYMGLGDGGGAGDAGAGHVEGGNAQSRDTLLGKILRIDPTPSGGAPYSIPSDNPFAGGGGMPEIWAYGLRNPWRFSWDRETADMWIADVGQNQWEEIDFVRAGRGAGANYGWNRVEGNHEFSGAAPAGAVGPIHEYSHAGGGCSISGGYVYRGSKIPGLTGQYLFSDYCDSTIRSIRERGGKVADQRDLGLKANQVTAFGQDQDGQLYVLSQGDGVQRVDPA